MDLIKKLNYGGKELRYYAGSPMIAAQLLRSQDRALLTELHPSDFPLLRNNFKEFKNITTKSEMVSNNSKRRFLPRAQRLGAH